MQVSGQGRVKTSRDFGSGRIKEAKSTTDFARTHRSPPSFDEAEIPVVVWPCPKRNIPCIRGTVAGLFFQLLRSGVLLRESRVKIKNLVGLDKIFG